MLSLLISDPTDRCQEFEVLDAYIPTQILEKQLLANDPEIP